MKKFISISMVIVLLVSMSVSAFATTATSIVINVKKEQNQGLGLVVRAPFRITPTNATVTYSSSDTSVATINERGHVTSVGLGKTTITARSGNVRESYNLTVIPLSIGSEPREDAKNPGLGVRGLHKQGITGKGVNIAYIGPGIQNGNLNNFKHTEFRNGMIKEYVNLGYGSNPTYPLLYRQLSALSGKTVGTAPESNIYLLGVPLLWGGPPIQIRHMTAGIEWVIEKNKSLSNTDKIRIIVMAPWGGSLEGEEQFWDAVDRAGKSGIIIPDYGMDPFTDYGYYDTNSPDDVSKAKIGKPGATEWHRHPRAISAASERRTLAMPDNSYEYFNTYVNVNTEYIAGIIALGFQVNPKLTNAQMVKLLKDTATNDIVNPPKFIEAVKRTVK
ncbi:MAG: Ig-like domain-containing protein [Oscillospiraceae bacterium]|nr:Ig-like domain-containing protein [Oscillospiraceae bacterium]